MDIDSEIKGTLNVGNTLSGRLTVPSSVVETIYNGDYEVMPKTYSQTLNTKHKLMNDDVHILEIPYFETSNESDGITVYIANTLA